MHKHTHKHIQTLKLLNADIDKILIKIDFYDSNFHLFLFI